MQAEDELQQQLRALFAEELDDGLQLLGPGLLALEEQAGSAGGQQLVQELFRAAHSLKGAAHAAAVPEAVNACDRLESALAAIRDGDRAPDAGLVTQLLTDVDDLSALAVRLHEQHSPTAAGASRAAPAPRVSDPGPAAPPSPMPVPLPTGSLRITSEKVDALLRRAGEGLAVSRRLHELAEQAATVAEQVDLARARLRAERLPEPRAEAGLRALLDDASRAATELARTVQHTDRALHHTSSGVVEAVQRLRTSPFAEACSSFDRVVRDVTGSTGTLARLVVTGGNVDVDRGVITALREPLLHLVRNAADHALEGPDERAAAGKPTTGTIEVAASLEGSLLHVRVRDDGRGIDVAQLREAAARRGLTVPADELELAFTPGLSSRADVTDVSGRGVGLDAARARLEQLGGTLQVVSTPGAGTEVRITAPVSLAVLRVLLVRAGGQVVALPTASVERVAQVAPQSLQEVEGQVLLTLGRRTLRAASLRDALGFEPEPAGAGADEELGVVIPRGGTTVLVAEELLDELEVAVQPVPARLAGAPGVLGVTLLSGGAPAVVVNPVAVGRSAAAFAVPTPTEGPAAAARILLAEDTITTRALERSILEAAGYTVAVAVDGTDAWQQLQEGGTDLVVSDVDMPRMSGIDLCRRIRSSSRLRELPVVLVTSLDTPEHRQRGLEAGADAYVVKGELSQRSLLDAVARLL